MKAWARLSALFALAFVLSTGGVSAQDLSSQAPPYPIAFVGNTVVDLKWSTYSGADFEYYRILRGTTEIARFTSSAAFFYRDSGVGVGATLTYKWCLKRTDANETCQSATITTGQVQGSLWQSLTLPGGTHSLVADVQPQAGVTFTAGNGVKIVRSPTATGAARLLDNTGAIRLEGATVEGVPITLSQAESTLRNCTITGQGDHKLIELSKAFASAVTGNTFNHATVRTNTTASLTLSGNRFYETSVGVGGAGGTVRDNEFEGSIVYGTSLLYLGSYDSPVFTVTGNDFRPVIFEGGGTALSRLTGKATIEENHFYFDVLNQSYSDRPVMWVGGTGDLVFSRNTIECPGYTYPGSYISGLELSGTDPYEITITDNVLTGCYYGFMAGVNVSGAIARNTIMGGSSAVVLSYDAPVTVNQNCLADNYAGLDVRAERTLPIDATNNWWGDSSGPDIYTNPDGAGSAIVGDDGMATYRPWVTARNCATAPVTPTVGSVTVELPADEPPADGVTVVSLRALVKDPAGAPLSGVTVSFSAEPALGRFATTAVVTGADGRATVPYTVPRSIDLPAGSDSVTIRAVAGGAAGTGLLRLAVQRCIRVRDEAGWDLPGADAYINGELQGVTDSEGKLCTYVALNDELIARWLAAEYIGAKPVHNLDSLNQWSFRAYITSMDPDSDGHPAPFVVADTKVDQVLVVRRTNPLLGFNVVAVLTWDATPAYLTQVVEGFESASKYLYDVSNGQMLFERVTIYDNGQHLAGADYQIRSSNQEWPRAHVRGIDLGTGRQITLGRYFNGKSASTGRWTEPSGYRTMVHEFGHYGLALYDSYFGYYGSEKRPAYCTGANIRTNTRADANASVMDFQFNASELAMRGVSGLWSDYCQQGNQWQVYGMSDWEAVRARFTTSAVTIRTPNPVVLGPESIPAPSWSQVSVGANADTGVCNPASTVQIVSPEATKMVFQVDVKRVGGAVVSQGETDDWGRIGILGGASGDLLIYRQVWPATETPLSGSTALSCVDPQVIRFPPPPLHLDIVIRPGAAANEVQVSVLPTQVLVGPPTVLLHQWGSAPVAVSMALGGGSTVYRGTAALDASLPLTGNAQVSAASALGPAFYITPFAIYPVAAAESATLWSADGQAELYLPAGTLPDGARVSIQPVSVGTVATSLEAQATKTELAPLVGPFEIAIQGGNLTQGAALSLFYSDASGLAPGTDPATMSIYRWNGSVWSAMEATADRDHRYVAARLTEAGVYALWAERSWLTYVPVLANEGTG